MTLSDIKNDIEILSKVEEVLSHHPKDLAYTYAHGLISGLLERKRAKLLAASPIQWGDWRDGVRPSTCGQYRIFSLTDGYTANRVRDGVYSSLNVKGEEFPEGSDLVENNLFFEELIHALYACEANKRREGDRE